MRTEKSLDAWLMLLDRQIVDVDGQMVAKVDDVELCETDDGGLVVTGLLTGPAALVPRLGGRFGDAVEAVWKDVGRQYVESGVPGWIDLDDIADLGSDVRLRVGRDRLIRPQPEYDDQRRHRLGELIGMTVRHRGDRIDRVDPVGRVGTVLDVRVDGAAVERGARAAVTSLVVGRGRPGARLGYDRRPEQGPRVLSVLVHALQGSRGVVPMDAVEVVDWEHERVEITAPPRRLRPGRS